MSYQALARKWRPHTFNELVGQEHVVRALSNALNKDQLHHAYLFTGTRGVGKTTIARILSKALNCEQGVSATPCGECSSCQEVDQGRFADLIEVDAASRTKVDQTRELLENVPYAPIRGRYKIYLIDEVHMFSESSFNALLKTLEEPPPHVKFLLATTDPKKVPVTVLSRCLQFNLKRLPVEQIRGQFEHILKAEQVKAEPAALEFLARMADGSMRDGLSILDQAISYGDGEVREAETKAMLGAVALDRLPQLLELLQAGDGPGILNWVEESATLAPDFSNLLKELILLLHRVALLQVVPGAADSSWGSSEAISALSETMSSEDVQLYYQIALIGQRDLYLAPDPRSGFEMTLLRMLAFRPENETVQTSAVPKKKLHQIKKAAPVKAQPAPVKAQPEPVKAQPAPVKAVASAKTVKDVVSEPPAAFDGNCDWHLVMPKLKLGGMSAQLASHCTVKKWDDRGLQLNLDPKGSALMGSLAQERLQEALNTYCGKQIKLEIEVQTDGQETPAQRVDNEQQTRQAAALDAMESDPLVKALQEDFDATLIKASVRPVD